MAKTAQDVLRQIKDEGIELIDLKFVDLHGKWQHLTVCEDLIDEAAFIEGVAFDGEALPRVLAGEAGESRRGPLFFRRPPDRGAYYGVANLPDLAVRHGRWKLLCEYDGSGAELYDLESDPGETRDLAARHPEETARLQTSLLEWHRAMPPDNGATYRPSPAKGKKKQG